MVGVIPRRVLFHGQDIHAAIFRGETPTHAFLEHDAMDTRLDCTKLEKAFSGVDDIPVLADGTIVLVGDKYYLFGMVERSVYFTAGPIFP
jgi:hypothetical protein